MGDDSNSIDALVQLLVVIGWTWLKKSQEGQFSECSAPLSPDVWALPEAGLRRTWRPEGVPAGMVTGMLKSEDRSACRSFLRWLCCGGMGAIPTVLFVAARMTVTLPPARHLTCCNSDSTCILGIALGLPAMTDCDQDLSRLQSPSSLVELEMMM